MRVYNFAPLLGAIAQLGERLHGMQEVDGSIPSGSTKFFDSCLFSRNPVLRSLSHAVRFQVSIRPHRLEA